MPRKERYDVEDVGIIEPENAVFTFCENVDAINKLRQGETCYATFRSGAGKDTLRVTRVHDAE